MPRVGSERSGLPELQEPVGRDDASEHAPSDAASNCSQRRQLKIIDEKQKRQELEISKLELQGEMEARSNARAT